MRSNYSKLQNTYNSSSLVVQNVPGSYLGWCDTMSDTTYNQMVPGSDTCSASCPYSFNPFQQPNSCNTDKFTKTDRKGPCGDGSCVTTDPCVICIKNVPAPGACPTGKDYGWCEDIDINSSEYHNMQSGIDTCASTCKESNKPSWCDPAKFKKTYCWQDCPQEFCEDNISGCAVCTKI